ncbi:Fructosamine/Ketosamine-3-kinase [Xylariomycetidae sp. FL2044]|nr:Fructosamine/Ketosamine-3-kinase [Xylariomycetidae sp. FL2044]
MDKVQWSIGHHVAIEVENEEQEYFLKIIERPDWVDMARAEYDAQQALSAVIPENVVPPIAWGFFENDNTKSFYLTSFRRLSPRVPPIPKILAIVKKLHQTSISPTGKFGFQSTTYWGPPKMVNDWTDSWEEYWSRQFRSDIKYAQGVYGEDSDLANLTEEFIQKAVARLLRPLQTGGRTIKPSLCHGDLWDGNVQTDDDTKQPVLFDSACFYGHREVDLQAIGEPRYSLRMNVVDMYMNEVGADEPRDDFYDRHFLYGIRNDVVVAAICPEWESLLETAKEKMRKLLDKFPDGFEGFEASTRARRDSAFAD